MILPGYVVRWAGRSSAHDRGKHKRTQGIHAGRQIGPAPGSGEHVHPGAMTGGYGKRMIYYPLTVLTPAGMHESRLSRPNGICPFPEIARRRRRGHACLGEAMREENRLLNTAVTGARFHDSEACDIAAGLQFPERETRYRPHKPGLSVLGAIGRAMAMPRTRNSWPHRWLMQATDGVFFQWLHERRLEWNMHHNGALGAGCLCAYARASIRPPAVGTATTESHYRHAIARDLAQFPTLCIR